MLRPIIHMILHFAAPAVLARIAYPDTFARAWLIMVATMLVDLDHLIADPIYDAGRCSIGFHPLHQYPMLGIYALLMLAPKLRLIGIGLLLHMFLDVTDCFWIGWP